MVRDDIAKIVEGKTAACRDDDHTGSVKIGDVDPGFREMVAPCMASIPRGPLQQEHNHIDRVKSSPPFERMCGSPRSACAVVVVLVPRPFRHRRAPLELVNAVMAEQWGMRAISSLP